MKITIEGEPKEIADLVLELQDRREDVSADNLSEAIIGRFQDLQKQAWQKHIAAVRSPEETMHTLTIDEMPPLFIE